jgi:hypothetical protein
MKKEDAEVLELPHLFFYIIDGSSIDGRFSNFRKKRLEQKC